MEQVRQHREVEYVPFWEVDDVSRDMLAKEGGEHYYTPMSKAKHLYILQDIKRITSKLGLRLNWPPSPDNQHWEIPHLAYVYARRHGKGGAFFGKIHEYRWERGENICDPSTVARIAGECGLDGLQAADAFQDPSVREEGVGELMKAYQDGVFGIPFFVHGYDKFWGVDRFGLFVRSLKGELPQLEMEAGPYLPYYETDHPGGCG